MGQNDHFSAELPVRLPTDLTSARQATGAIVEASGHRFIKWRTKWLTAKGPVLHNRAHPLRGTHDAGREY